MTLLTDCIHWESLLHETVQHAALAQQRLHEATPGFPATSTGNGEPGGGTHGHGDTIVERLADTISGDHVLAKLQALSYNTGLASTLAGELVHTLTGSRPIEPSRPAIGLHLAHAYRCVLLARYWLDNTEPGYQPPRFGPARQLTQACTELYQITGHWGVKPSEPATPKQASELLAIDLTGLWCTSCLRAGWRNPRYQNAELCNWCYKFKLGEGFTPPRKLITLRSESITITEKHVAPYRQANRTRKRPKSA